ncbi:MAG: zf-TFIIB domain-containing protein [Gallionellaceae bacterium]|nr:zf-TFIIB domain-containing protein [Gallionellaceae bacterium]
MKCPVCKETDLLMTERMGVEIDYCPQCRGIWLDRGELDKLMEKAEQGVGAPDLRGQPGGCQGDDRHHEDRQHKDHHGHGGYGHGQHYSRRRSWLGNLFDFD